MEDEQIMELYWARQESAIAETADKYGRYCRSIAYRILQNDEDSEECVNDAYMRVWNTIPPQRPAEFKAFLGKIVRNLALDVYDRISRKSAAKGRWLWRWRSCRSVCPPLRRRSTLSTIWRSRNS